MPFAGRLAFALLLSATLAREALAADAPPLVREGSANPGDIRIVESGHAADLYVDDADMSVVRIAVRLFADDVATVTGVKPKIVHDLATSTPQAVLIGTIGHSKAIDALIAAGKLDVSSVRGKWETFVIATVEHPLPGVDRALVVAGSDRRGTAFGTFELSEQIGVSPWSWWADVPAKHHDSLTIAAGTHIVGPPSVKYRGFFLNDEDWGLQPWSAKTFEPDAKTVGPKTYTKIFELMLRLKADYLWPAMHPCTTEFGALDANLQAADDWGIVMGASHPEPMNRNNVWYDAKTRGPWRYDTNRDGVMQYWREWAQKRGKYEAVWTVGMRGIHDSGLPGPDDVHEQGKLVSQSIRDQRQLLTEFVAPDAATVPQAFVPYKEVLAQYRAGMEVPDDITLVWCDDNYGYLRQLSTAVEQKRSGKAGIYYHASYLGWPNPYLWIDTTPPALIADQMQTAVATGADRIWVLNVGDLKGCERAAEFWARLAWKTDRYPTRDAQDAFLSEWSSRDFGPEVSPRIVALLNDYYAFCTVRKPELLRSNVFAAGPETTTRLVEAARLNAEADSIAAALPADRRDAFFELVGYPVHVAANLNLVYLNADESDRASVQLRPVANAFARRAADALQRLRDDTDAYNHRIAGGKWNDIVRLDGMAGFAQYGNWGTEWPKRWLEERAEVEPDTSKPKLAVLIDGRNTPLIDGKPAPDAFAKDDYRWSIADETLPSPWQHIGAGVGVPNTPEHHNDANPATPITHTFDIARAGKYRLFAEVATPTKDDDSFFIRIDDEPWQTWNDIANSHDLTWRQQGVYSLSAGQHRVSIAPREDGASVRTLLLTPRPTATQTIDPLNLEADALTLVSSLGGSSARVHVYRTDGQPLTDLRVEGSDGIVEASVDESASTDSDKVVVVRLARSTTIATAAQSIVQIHAMGQSQSLHIRIAPLPADGTFGDVDGVVSMEAEHATRFVGRGGLTWSVRPHLGRSGDAVAIDASTPPSITDPVAIQKTSPALEYDFTTGLAGEATLHVYSLPGYSLEESRGLRYAVAIDDASPQVVETAETGGGSGEHGDRWFDYKLRNIAETMSRHQIASPGKHTLRLWMVDPNLVVDKLVLDQGGLRPSELGPAETRQSGLPTTVPASGSSRIDTK